MIAGFNSSGTGLLHLSYARTFLVASPVCLLGYGLGFFCPKLLLSTFFKSGLSGLLKLQDCLFKNYGCNALQEVKLDNQDSLLGPHDFV